MFRFIAMMAYYKLYIRLKEQGSLSKYSPNDIIELSKSIYKLKINGDWKILEITKKTHALFSLIGIDIPVFLYLNIKFLIRIV
ncbi:MAG: hypothetical protein M9887_04270 [Chitinophagales bacterium]|nr:hypothetical protein [Chitinophagales bacterium]